MTDSSAQNETDAPVLVPGHPAEAVAVFGDRIELAERFAAILADTGVSHGLIGPREVPRLWTRHLLNCAVIEDAFPIDARVIDIGSGAGLPGIALAIARPDLDLHLVEPMLRRTAWLQNAVDDLGLQRVTVHRGRAEDFHGVLSAAYATARAVARIDKLARWSFPLLAGGGVLVAMKGSAANDELEAERTTLTGLGMTGATVRAHGVDLLDEPTITIELVVAHPPLAGRATTAASGGRRRGRG